MSRILILILLSISLLAGLFFSFHRRQTDSFKILLLPHNEIYGPKVAEFFDKNYRPKVKTVIILGPNHKDLGPPILESGDDYSIQNITPAVKKIYPDAKIISYIIRPSHDLSKTLLFSKHLKENYDPKESLIVVSVDFSHYTSRSEADIFDQETINALDHQDYNQLINWGPEHTDCPDCLIISSYLSPEFVLTNNEYLNGTSYFFGYFH